MQIGFVGLGKMGGNMVARILRDSDHQVVAYDPDAKAVATAVERGATGAGSLEELVEALAPPRTVWIMVPSGAPTRDTIKACKVMLAAGDLIIDGGNSNYQEDELRANDLSEAGVHYVDVGTSGGIWGLDEGYCMMVGGDPKSVERLKPILDVLAPAGDPPGWRYFGGPGAGHYVKMVHNGIEYGLMQAYAEGFELMHASQYDIDLEQVAKLWQQGSVVRSWLCELSARAFEAEGNDLANLEGYVDDSGEGRWTIVDGIDRAVPMPVLSAALAARFYSRGQGDYAARVLAALRNQFGGHAVMRTQR